MKIRPGRRTDMTKIIAASCNFANAPKNGSANQTAVKTSRRVTYKQFDFKILVVLFCSTYQMCQFSVLWVGWCYSDCRGLLYRDGQFVLTFGRNLLPPFSSWLYFTWTKFIHPGDGRNTSPWNVGSTYTVQEPKRRSLDVQYIWYRFVSLRIICVTTMCGKTWLVDGVFFNPWYIQNVKRRNTTVIYDSSCSLQSSEDGLSAWVI